MRFRVFAKQMGRTMYCGTLTVTSSGLHIHRDVFGNLVLGKYKPTRLERVQ